MKLAFFVALLTISTVGLTKAAPRWPPIGLPPIEWHGEDVDQRALLQGLLSSMMKSSTQVASEQRYPFFPFENEDMASEQGTDDDTVWFLKLLQQQIMKQEEEEAEEERCVCIRSPCPCSRPIKVPFLRPG